MSGGIAVLQRDNDYLITGTAYSLSQTVTDHGKDFKSCGASIGLAIQNLTTGAFGHLTAVSEGAFTADISFSPGDKYEIYHTETYNAVISKVYVDRRFGHKVTNTDELIDGIFPEDRDVDEDGRKVFGPGEPWSTRI